MADSRGKVLRNFTNEIQKYPASELKGQFKKRESNRYKPLEEDLFSGVDRPPMTLNPNPNPLSKACKIPTFPLGYANQL